MPKSEPPFPPSRSPKFRGWRFNEPPFVHYLLAGFEHLHSAVALAANLLIIVHCYGVRGTTDNNDGTLVVHLYLFLDGAPAIPQICTDRLAILSTTMHTSTQQLPTTGARHPTNRQTPSEESAENQGATTRGEGRRQAERGPIIAVVPPLPPPSWPRVPSHVKHRR